MTRGSAAASGPTGSPEGHPASCPGPRTSGTPCAGRSRAAPCRAGTPGWPRFGLPRPRRPRRRRGPVRPAARTSARAGRIRRRTPTKSIAIRAPTVARRNRGASCCTSNRHHRSCENSTCRNANSPSHDRRADHCQRRQRPSRWRRGCRTAPPCGRSSSRLRRQGQQQRGEHDRLLVVGALEQRDDDPHDQAGRAERVGRVEPPCQTPGDARAGRNRRGCRRSARARSPAAARTRGHHAMRLAADGVAPENISTAPPSIMNTASSFGATEVVSVPKALPHWPTTWRRWYELVHRQHHQRSGERHQVVDDAEHHQGGQCRFGRELPASGSSGTRTPRGRPARG